MLVLLIALIVHATTDSSFDVYDSCITFTVLDHPFLSGKVPTRLIGTPASCDVFLSYRVAADSKFVKMIYERCLYFHM